MFLASKLLMKYYIDSIINHNHFSVPYQVIVSDIMCLFSKAVDLQISCGTKTEARNSCNYI